MCCAYVDKPKLLVFSLALRIFFFGCSVFPFLNQHFQVAFHPGILTEVEVDSQPLHYYLFIYIYSYIFIYLFIYLPIFS